MKSWPPSLSWKTTLFFPRPARPNSIIWIALGVDDTPFSAKTQTFTVKVFFGTKNTPFLFLNRCLHLNWGNCFLYIKKEIVIGMNNYISNTQFCKFAMWKGATTKSVLYGFRLIQDLTVQLDLDICVETRYLTKLAMSSSDVIKKSTTYQNLCWYIYNSIYATSLLTIFRVLVVTVANNLIN